MSSPEKQRWKINETGQWLIIEWTESGHDEAFKKTNWHAARVILQCSTNELCEALFVLDPKLWLHRQTKED